MIDYATTEGGTLIRIKMMMGQFATHHLTDCMDEIPTVQVFEPVLIRVVCVGMPVKLMSGGIFNPVFVMSILRE